MNGINIDNVFPMSKYRNVNYLIHWKCNVFIKTALKYNKYIEYYSLESVFKS